MFQSSAREEALVEVGRSRGLVRGDQLDQILAGAGPGGLAHSLRSALPPGQLAALQDAARRTRFGCPRGCVALGFDDLASLASLACPRCGGGLRATDEPPRPTGAYAARPSDRHEPKVVAGYEVIEELGRGSFGVVYKVRRPGLERAFALKVLLRADVDPELLARFRLEAQIASKLEHPAIVGVFDAGLHGERPYLVMDYCPGQTLRERLRHGPLPPLEAARLVGEVARAVAFAHDHGVLHRDLKPANIILEASSGRPRVTDFGLARDRSLARSMTRTGDVVGTPAYAAPEQLRGEKGIDARIDVWALGVILYECLTGHRPFVGADVVSLAEQVLHGPLRAPRELEPGVPEHLEQVCLRALERERFRRTASAAALADELEGIVRAASAPRPGRRRAGRRSWLPALGALVVVAGAAGGVAVATRDAPPPATATEDEARTASATPPPEGDDPERSPAPAPDAPPSVVSEPPRAERAPDAEVEPLLDAAERMVRFHELRRPVDPEAMELVVKRGPALAERYPTDGRAVFVGAYGDLFGGKDELVARRAMVRSLSLDPPAPDDLRDRVARLCFALGFQRAAADLLEPVVAVERERVDARHALHLTLIVGKSALPVGDPQRSLQLARRAVNASDQDYADGDRRRDQPRAWEVRMALADMLLFHGEKDRAVAVMREASMRTRRNSEELAAEAARLEAASGVPAHFDVPLRNFQYDFGVTKFLKGVGDLITTADLGQERSAAAELEAMARHEAGARGPAKTALTLLAAARLHERQGARAEALRALEEAAALALPSDARDVRSLVCRALARALLDDDPARAERLALEAAVAASEEPACTRGERADAWVLVGFARRTRGDLAGVRDALMKVAALGPVDVRWAEALRDGRPLAPPPRAALPAPVVAQPEDATDLDALIADAVRVIRLNERRSLDDAAMTRLVRAAPGLTEQARTDGRAAFVVALAALLRGQDELEARRGLVAALRAAPDLSPVLRDRTARLCHALGFERAATDTVEPLFAGDQAPDPEVGLCLVQAYMKAAPPVQDVDRSIELLRRTLAVRAEDARDGDALSPTTWDLFANLGELLRFKRDDAGAAAAYREAASATRDPRGREFLAKLADAIAAGEIDRRSYDVPGRVVNFLFPLTDFLRRLAEPRARADRDAAERAVAPALVNLAEREVAARPDRAVLALVMAARLLERAGDVEQAVRLLEDAAAVSLPASAVDVRALLARTLGRLLVERDPARAEALALEAAQVPDDAPLTRGERADAWVIVGLARKARGDADGVREALDRATACDPFDRRGLAALQE